ncbi:NADP-dependent oxidoreductase [Sorangium cellulosum]|nr:NADP-dependent oxidoreductase [Sorangium cellulosum]
MNVPVNRRWLLASRPAGGIEEHNFTWAEEPAPELTADGQILIRNLYLSVDPAQRGWASRDTYVPAVPLGEVMRSFGAGRVVASRAPGFAPGDLVQGMVGWQDYVVLDAGGPSRPTRIPPGVSLPVALSAIGLTGLTAYFGLLDLGRPTAGETVVVSGAAGATGMMAGQIAKLKGCRVIGIAGGPDKCSFVVDQLGFDAAIDYKSEDVLARLGALCPKGIDVYFDNVGGEILDAALAHIALRGRVVLCGAISTYTAAELPPGPRNYRNLIFKRARMEGFIVIDYFDRAPEAAKELVGWVASGKIKDHHDVQEGLENAPRVLRRLFEGANLGKQLLKIADA